VRSLFPVLLASAALTLSACGSDAENADVAPVDTTPASTTPAAVPESTPESTPATDAAAGQTPGSATDVPSGGDGKCTKVAAAKPGDVDAPEPTGSLDASKKNVVTLKTNCGTIAFELDAKRHPKVANAVASLVKDGYYDGVSFHRVAPQFMIQGGDPNGDGTGSTKWSVVDAPPSDQAYSRGVVAMAKTGDAPAGSASNQFFIMVADVPLPPDYAVVGTVIKGMDTADAIDALGDTDGPPSEPVVISKATFQAK
jgi:cyclophilin family peptidyl-prolyl cis-trans isomerase